MFLPVPVRELRTAGKTGAPALEGVKNNDTWLPFAPVLVRALKIVELIRQGLDFESIRRHILERYRTDKDTVEKDYHDFLQMLDQYNLIDHDGKEEI